MLSIKLLAKILGGIWAIRKKYRATNSPVIKAIYRHIYNSVLQQKGSWISLSATFNGEPCFPHGAYGIFISGGAVVGRNCVIFQHVIIGSNTLYDSGGMGAPIIGDSCYIGAGATIIGNIKVGNNVRIGANTFVYQDVSDNSVITCGVPRVIRMKRQLNNKFYHKYNGQWKYFDNGIWRRVLESKELSVLDSRFG
jgi:serine O-acetyltransferase